MMYRRRIFLFLQDQNRGQKTKNSTQILEHTYISSAVTTVVRAGNKHLLLTVVAELHKVRLCSPSTVQDSKRLFFEIN